MAMAAYLASCGYIDYDYIAANEETTEGDDVVPTVEELGTDAAETVSNSVDATSNPSIPPVAPAARISRLDALAAVSSVTLEVETENAPSGASVALRRGFISGPAALADGVVVCDGCGVSTPDGALTNSVTYHYSAFLFDSGGTVLDRREVAAIPEGLWGATTLQHAYLKSTNSDNGDAFGADVVLSGDGLTMAVGVRDDDSATEDPTDNSETDSGAVQIYTLVGDAWVEQAYLKSGSPDGSSKFGIRLDLSHDGNTLVVSNDSDDAGGSGVGSDPDRRDLGNSGSVWIFERTGSSWSRTAYIKASDPDLSDQFGYAVALSADGLTLAVGAFGEDSSSTGVGGDPSLDGATDSGAAYIFDKSGGTWSQTAYLKASNAEADDLFGESLDISSDGNTLVVGARLEDSNSRAVNGTESSNGRTDSGAAYVFHRSGGVWTQDAYLKAPNADLSDWFGQPVAMAADGQTLAVGAGREDSSADGVDGNMNNNGAPQAGAIYTFVRSGNSWSFDAYLKASNSETNDALGFDINLSDDGQTLVSGSYGDDSQATGINGDDGNNAGGNNGSAYLFTRDSGTWSQAAYLKGPVVGDGDFFGRNVALSGTGAILAAGALFEDSAAQGIDGNPADDTLSNSGAVYVFFR